MKWNGEGNGNPLQYSCLENSMDRGAWWATVHGVTKSQTRLKRLTSSSSWKKKSILCFFPLLHLPRRRQWQLTPVLLPGKSHGRRSLVGCSPWGHEELDTTERLHFHLSLSCIGEGNGNPLQCSCLENPRDGGAWWAAVYGVAQSGTRLKRLSSSSSTYQNLYLPIYLIVYCLCNTIPILWGKIYGHRKGKNQKKYRVMICFFLSWIFFPQMS